MLINLISIGLYINSVQSTLNFSYLVRKGEGDQKVMRRYLLGDHFFPGRLLKMYKMSVPGKQLSPTELQHLAAIAACVQSKAEARSRAFLTQDR